MATIAEPRIGANDRLGFTVFVAVSLHAMIMLTDFIPEDPEPSPRTMEITLARYEDAQKPEQADFLAQSNQQGSGTEQEKSEITAPSQSSEQNMLIQESSSPAQETQRQTQQEKPVIATQAAKRQAATLFEMPVKQSRNERPEQNKSILERSLEIAQLEANLDDQLRNYARRPRVKRLIAASTMKAVDAHYVKGVVSKIERIGKLNFPNQSGRPLYGKPRVLISIYSDGSIKDVKVLESSGSLVLDSKTIDIVRRAAPFSPFPKEVRKEQDVLELIRTFSYNKKGVSSF
ncbi:MAG: energy transducer TonB [Oleiphilus sp.]|nr:MAG: energy transducer TonB [Oleiphilus sp.]